VEDRNTIVRHIGEIDDNATLLKQARYIEKLLNCAEEQGIRVQDAMRKCGRCCISTNTIKLAKALYAKSTSMPEFLTMLNEAGIGGGHLRLEQDRIVGEYTECLCNVPKRVDQMNALYCNCASGWYQVLFSEVLGREVTVKIIDTILNGAEKCTFEIIYY
jgi:predicted hydrocarbon binding protein